MILQKKLIIIPTHENPRVICDFILQTSRILTQSKNKVLIIEQKHYLNWKKLLKQNLFFLKKEEKILYYNYFYFIPQKVSFLFSNKIYQQLNKSINELISELIILFLSINKKRYLWIFDLKIDWPKFNLLKKEIILDIVDFFEFKKYKEKIEKADFIFVNSLTLQKLIKKISNRKTFLVPQGFAYQNFDVKVKYQKNKRPKIGFIGEISNRLDYDLLIPLAKSLKKLDFIFIGPISNDPKIKKNKSKQIKEFLSLPNVKKIKPVKKEKIPELIANFDIGIIPYDISENFNRYCYPMKLFEYFYIRKPVIATPIEELKEKKFKNLIKIGRNNKDWEKHIKKILSVDWPKENKIKQKQLAVNNSWENKIELISHYVGN